MTTLIAILLFLHILAVAGLFAGIGIELASFTLVRRARTGAEARAAMAAAPFIGPIMGVTSATLIIAGLSMVFVAGYGWQAWNVTGLLVAVALSVNGPLTNGRRMERIHALADAAGDAAIPPELDAARRDRFLTYSVGVLLTLLVCMLYIMSNKPGLAGCIIAVIMGLALPLVPTLRAGETARVMTLSERT